MVHVSTVPIKVLPLSSRSSPFWRTPPKALRKALVILPPADSILKTSYWTGVPPPSPPVAVCITSPTAKADVETFPVKVISIVDAEVTTYVIGETKFSASTESKFPTSYPVPPWVTVTLSTVPTAPTV